MEQSNDGIDEVKLKLSVLIEINQVIRGHQLKREQVLTVGDVMSFIDIAIVNVKVAVKLQKKSNKVHG